MLWLFEMKNKIISILKLNIALIFTAILVGIIVSFVAQMFAFTAKEVYKFLQVAKDFEAYTFILFVKKVSSTRNEYGLTQKDH